MSKISIKIYETESGKKPFMEWFNSLDKKNKERILSRFDRLYFGNNGDFKSIDEDIYELRFNFSSGYRIYYGLDGDVCILLLCGGDKSSQKRDIEKAKQYFKDYKENK